MNAENLIIQKSIAINAAREKVWQILLQDQFTRIWYAEFSEGAHAVTDWQEGNKALFLDNDGNGIAGVVALHKPHEVISVEYQGLVQSNTEDYESQEAKEVKGGRETYWLTEENGHTKLAIELTGLSDEYFDMMAAAWDKALEKIKILSENSSGI